MQRIPIRLYTGTAPLAGEVPVATERRWLLGPVEGAAHIASFWGMIAAVLAAFIGLALLAALGWGMLAASQAAPAAPPPPVIVVRPAPLPTVLPSPDFWDLPENR